MSPALILGPPRQDLQVVAATIRLPQRHCTCANVPQSYTENCCHILCVVQWERFFFSDIFFGDVNSLHTKFNNSCDTNLNTCRASLQSAGGKKGKNNFVESQNQFPHMFYFQGKKWNYRLTWILVCTSFDTKTGRESRRISCEFYDKRETIKIMSSLFRQQFDENTIFMCAQAICRLQSSFFPFALAIAFVMDVIIENISFYDSHARHDFL